MNPMVVEAKGLGAALTLIIAGSYADGIDIAPVTLLLRMLRGIAIDLGSGSLENLGLGPFS